MITMNESLMILYSWIFILLFNSCSNFFFWVMMELNMIIFISICFFSSFNFMKMELYDFSLFYFIIQMIGSITFLIFSCFSFFLKIEYFTVFILMSLMLKSGLFPFSMWLYNSIFSLSFVSLILLISTQKVPMYFFIFSFTDKFILFISFFSLIMGSYYLSFSFNWFEIMVSSSIYSFFWFFCTYMISMNLFIIFFIMYIFFVLFFSSFYYVKFFQGFTDFVTLAFVFTFFFGLPPLSLFFFKSYFSFFVFLTLGSFYLILVWFFTFFSAFGYFKFFFYFFYPSFLFYNSFSNLKFLYNFFFFFLIYGMLFFFFKGKLF